MSGSTTTYPAPSSSDNNNSNNENINNNNNNNNNNSTNDENSTFECNICLEQSTEPVITLCGHLFCWVCIYKWMQQTQHRPQCPVCKSSITTEKLIPLYGRGKEQNDPRKKIPEGMPNRPSGQHAEPPPAQYQNQNFGFFPGTTLTSGNVGGISFSAGIGFFPSLFGLQFQFPNNPTYPNNASPQEVQDPHLFLSRVFFMLAIFVLVFLLFF